MNAAATHGSLSGKALKFETAASELFFLRGKTLVDSTFFLLRYFLKETPAFNIFLLIPGIPSSTSWCLVYGSQWLFYMYRFIKIYKEQAWYDLFTFPFISASFASLITPLKHLKPHLGSKTKSLCLPRKNTAERQDYFHANLCVSCGG